MGILPASMRSLQERDAVIERWLKEEVVAVYDAMKENPSRAIPAAQVFATIRARHQDRMIKRNCEPQD